MIAIRLEWCVALFALRQAYVKCENETCWNEPDCWCSCTSDVPNTIVLENNRYTCELTLMCQPGEINQSENITCNKENMTEIIFKSCPGQPHVTAISVTQTENTVANSLLHCVNRQNNNYSECRMMSDKSCNYTSLVILTNAFKSDGHCNAGAKETQNNSRLCTYCNGSKQWQGYGILKMKHDFSNQSFCSAITVCDKLKSEMINITENFLQNSEYLFVKYDQTNRGRINLSGNIGTMASCVITVFSNVDTITLQLIKHFDTINTCNIHNTCNTSDVTQSLNKTSIKINLQLSTNNAFGTQLNISFNITSKPERYDIFVLSQVGCAVIPICIAEQSEPWLRDILIIIGATCGGGAVCITVFGAIFIFIQKKFKRTEEIADYQLQVHGEDSTVQSKRTNDLPAVYDHINKESEITLSPYTILQNGESLNEQNTAENDHKEISMNSAVPLSASISSTPDSRDNVGSKSNSLDDVASRSHSLDDMVVTYDSIHNADNTSSDCTANRSSAKFYIKKNANNARILNYIDVECSMQPVKKSAKLGAENHTVYEEINFSQNR